MNFKEKCEELIKAREAATPGEWIKFNVFGSRDLTSSIEVETGEIEILADVECEKRISICEVGDSDKHIYDFDFIVNAANNSKQIAEGALRMMTVLRGVASEGNAWSSEAREVLAEIEGEI